ncbi:MAG TPA: ABC transporter permease [Gemmatimonadaceae bacterium]|nr:ABC transporter permease [Gemmatimonadaceae bacterium]
MTDRELSSGAQALYARCLRVVRAASMLVPADRQQEWLDEWRGELWYRATQLDRTSPIDSAKATGLLVRSFGAIPHALWALTEAVRLDPMLQDLRYALRGMVKRPMFAALIVATLALGIGANSAMFSIVNSVLLKPLPYDRPDELVYMYGSFSQNGKASVSPPDYLDYRARNSVFTSLAARTILGAAVVGGGTDPERVGASIASANFFGTLGVKPYRGRVFLPEEETGASDVAVISYGLWQRRFAGDAKIIGQPIVIDGKPHTVVGIMPPALDRTMDVQVWRPIAFNTPETSVRRFHFLRLVGRLKPGVTLEQAQRHMDDISRSLAATYPENESWHLALSPYRDVIIGGVGPVLFILLGAVGLVLLIACGNVASLLLARATARSGEMAVRTALGAGRGRLVRQLLTESLVLGLVSGVVGLVLAHYLLAGVRLVGDGLLPRLGEVEMDSAALAFTVAVSLLTSLVFGAAPALHAVRPDLAATMKSLGKTSATRAGAYTRDTLVVAQVALSFVLLIGAGLLVRSLWELQHVETGFESTRVLTGEVSLPRTRYKDRSSIEQFWVQYLDRVRAIPGVESAAATTLLPLRGGGDTYFYIEGQPPASDAQRMNATVSTVSDDYFATLRIAVTAGRAFAPADRGNGPGVMVINQGLAKRLFPNASAIGKRLVVDFGKPFTAEIVGVVGDVRVYGQANDAPDLMYFFNGQPAAGFGTGTMNIAMRVRGDPGAFVAKARDALHALEPDVPFASPQSMDAILSESVSGARFRTQLLAGFAGVALLLAVVGLYGMLAYTVTQRSREMGIRIALGARSMSVFQLVLRQGMTLVIIGVVLGVGGALAATRLLSAQLFAVAPTDPAVFVGVAVSLTLAGLAACVIPARRATRADPILALRQE